MCRWIGSHVHDWIDYNGVTFLVELLEWGPLFSGFLGWETSGKLGFKNRRITIMTFPLTKNVCISIIYDGTFVYIYGWQMYQNVCTVGEK